MAFHNDLNNFSKLWTEASSAGRIVLIFSSFLILSSAMGIAELIVKWDGYFADAQEFYKLLVRQPIKQAFAFIGLEPFGLTVDFLILQCTIYLSPIYALHKLKHPEKSAIRELCLPSLGLLAAGALCMEVYLSDPDSHWWGILAWLLFMANVYGECYRTATGVTKIKIAYLVILPFYGALFLAQVNEGLSQI